MVLASWAEPAKRANLQHAISIALDDFGTGYTSIAYLRRYGFNRVKIDKSLTGGIVTNTQEATLIAGTVFLARGLSMAVTAEGVENEDQANLLRLAGCQHLQGFLFSKAVDIETLELQWLNQQASRHSNADFEILSQSLACG